MMKFGLLLEDRDVNDMITRAAKVYHRGGDKSLSRFMGKYVWQDGFLDKFKQWFDNGYFRDLLPPDGETTPSGGVRLPVQPNPAFLFRKVAIARAGSLGHGNYKKIDHYLQQAWKKYAKDGPKALSEYIAQLPPGVFYRFRQHFVGQGGMMTKDNVFYQFAQYVKNMPWQSSLHIGDYLHRQSLERHLYSAYAKREDFAAYPELEREFDKMQAERERKRQERQAAQQVADLRERRPNGANTGDAGSHGELR